MRIYMLKREDFQALLTALDRNAAYGQTGGSSTPLTAEELAAHDRAHSFFNYHIRMWIDRVQGD